ncbi:MAG TPA: hypothetical protein VF310_17115, partial [Vicinamibacteria bacterium]
LACLVVVGPLWWQAPVGRIPLPTALPASGFEPLEEPEAKYKMPADAGALRREALQEAKLWRLPAALDLRENPPAADGFASDGEYICKFLPRKSSGATPKFECVFEGGQVLKVKYGRNPEVHTEVAATRLLEALGAGADRMYLVRTLRCFGCPADPHELLKCFSSRVEDVRRTCAPRFGSVNPQGGFEVKVDYAKYVDFGPVAIERRMPGDAIETEGQEGWGWEELEKAQHAAGGATLAERDALRLMAVLLQNWDNRPDNQRLLCLPGPRPDGGPCPSPFAYMQDVGATFGSARGGGKEGRKLDVEAWRAAPVWEHAPTCRVKIVSPPLHGATFGELTISDSGRRFLAERLGRLTEQDIRGLFEGTRVADYEGARPASRDVGQWVGAFQEKVRQIAEREPCRTP